MPVDLPSPPRAENYSVAEIVADGRRGRLRIPSFQRPLKWSAEDVALLFDSLLHGYPIGSLLLWRGPPPPAGPAQLGPVTIPQPQHDDVRWVVDGQQRVVSLVAALSADGSSDPRFGLWFDADEQRFLPRPRGAPSASMIPVWRLLDAADLGEFLLDWPASTPARRRACHEAGKRLREYRVPATVVEAADVDAVRVVFRRMNSQGKRLTDAEVFDGWAAPQGGLTEVGAELAQLGWGDVPLEVLLAAALVNAGRDPTRKTEEAQAPALSSAGRDVYTGLVRCIAFLRDRAAIPHIDLLPYNYVLQVLPAFFARHGAPSARSETLLSRWVWRVFEAGRTDPTFLRAATRAAQADGLSESQQVSALLAAVPSANRWTFDPAARFRSDSGAARIGLVALAQLAPIDLRTGVEFDVASVIREGGAIQQLVDGPRKGALLLQTIANRTLHPGPVALEPELARWARDVGLDAAPLVSHAVSPAAIGRLLAGDRDGFLELRGATIERLVADHFRRFAARDQDDRPSLRELWAS